MKSAAFYLLFLVLSATAASAAETPTWELAGSSTASFASQTTNSKSTQILSTSFTVGYFVLPKLEATLGIGFLNYAPSSSLLPRSLSLLAGPTYNFNDDIGNSIYLGAQAGLISIQSSPPMTCFAYSAFLGRRVQIVEHVSWSPQVGVFGHREAKSTQSTLFATFAWVIVPLQFAILL